ncbi:neural cell adhesion molecule 2 [Procambarus clarkii]|uniref:neural cell adhesion molecule 2 n=1 Tax=Procambarus clarkii TaxID=6728 RepID=UPI003744454A
MCRLCLLLLLSIFSVLLSTLPSTQAQNDHMWSVTGVAGRSSDLPCYLNPRTPGDRPKLILWYKRGGRTPVFSHDGRVPQMRSDIKQNEGTLTVSRGAATLTLHNLTVSQAAVYECRVDFFKSPTHTNFVNLTIIEPASSLEVVDSEGDNPVNGILGPYREGVSITFTCTARGGSPSPNVTWWRSSEQLSATWHQTGPDLVSNDLRVERLTRDWHNQTVTCLAANTHLAGPVTISILIQMFLLPTSVVVSNPGPVSEGQQVRLVCTSTGSRPSATLSWTVRGVTRPAQKENLMYGEVTSSTLVTNLTRGDHNTKVTCRAANPAVPDSPLANSTSLIVHYPPTVSASLGRSLRPELLKEGDDVYFTCTVEANPPASTITWYHEGTAQVQNVTQGVILAGDSLVLQKVGRRQAGQYTCSATNTITTATSEPVTLRIKYKPVCQISPTTYFIYDKPINVTCSVSSFPPVRSILWQWNSSSEVISTEVTNEEEQQRTWAQLTVEPIQTREDRTLTCWAVNEMGKQATPCGFAVKVAQMPLPLSSCRLANITDSSLSLSCQRPDVAAAGTTLYRAEVYFENRTLFANVTSHRPNFNVSRLDAETSYQIKVYVTHGPVTSQPVVVSAYTSRTSRTATDSRGGSTSVGKVLGGLLLLLLVLVAGVWLRHYCRKANTRRKHDPRLPSDESNPDVVPNTVEDTFDLLAAGAAKSELPILTPVYDAVGVSLQEGVARKSLASAEVYPDARLQSKDSENYQALRLQHNDHLEGYPGVRAVNKDSKSYPGVRLTYSDPEDDQGLRPLSRGSEEYLDIRTQHQDSSDEYPTRRLHNQESSPEEYPGKRRQHQDDNPEECQEKRLRHEDLSPEEYPGRRFQRQNSPEEYPRISLQHQDPSEEYLGRGLQHLRSSEEFSARRLHHHDPTDDYHSRRFQHQDSPEEYPGSHHHHHHHHDPSDECPDKRLQQEDSEDYTKARTDFHCPVDQLMQATETVV